MGCGIAVGAFSTLAGVEATSRTTSLAGVPDGGAAGAGGVATNGAAGETVVGALALPSTFTGGMTVSRAPSLGALGMGAADGVAEGITAAAGAAGVAAPLSTFAGGVEVSRTISFAGAPVTATAAEGTVSGVGVTAGFRAPASALLGVLTAGGVDSRLSGT